MGRALLRALALLILSSAMTTTTRANPDSWVLVPGRSQLVVHVFKKGLLSGVAHDHHFAPAEWRATARFDAARPSDARVEVVVAAGSLRDRQPRLPARDREKVDRQTAGPDVLDASRYPEIRFVSTEPMRAAPSAGPGAIEGDLAGTLSLHGHERALSVPVRAVKDGDSWRARGSVSFKQSDFGIEPYSGFLGTIAVQDEVKVEYDLILVPGS